MKHVKFAILALMAIALTAGGLDVKALAQNPPGDQQQWWNPGDWFDNTPNRWIDPGANESYDYGHDDGYGNDSDELNNEDYVGDYDFYDYGYDDDYGYNFDDDYTDRFDGGDMTDTNDWFTDDYWESRWNDDGLGEWDYHDPAWSNDDGYWDDSWD